MTSIMVISDTHVRSLKELSQELVNTLSEADYVVHCGDYNNIAVLQELRCLTKRFIGVYGNIDPREIQNELPAKTGFEVEGRRIGVIHPHWGGPPWGIEEDIAKEFEGVDIILFGHTHDTCHKAIDSVVFFNPGQAYPSFRNPASAGIITIDHEGIQIDIKTFE